MSNASRDLPTGDQIAQLQTLVGNLVSDKSAADAATAASNQADSVAAKATADAQQAKLDEATADAKATASLNALRSFVDQLAGTPTTGVTTGNLNPGGAQSATGRT